MKSVLNHGFSLLCVSIYIIYIEFVTFYVHCSVVPFSCTLLRLGDKPLWL